MIRRDNGSHVPENRQSPLLQRHRQRIRPRRRGLPRRRQGQATRRRRSRTQGPPHRDPPQAPASSSPARPTAKPADPAEPQVGDASTWGPVLVVRALFDQLGLWDILDQHLGRAKGVPFADRAFVLVANRLIAPASEHGLAGWLETDFVCDRKGRRFVPHWHQRRRVRVHPRQLDAWYRTLDQLHDGQGPDRSGALPPPPRPLQLQARPGALRHHQYLLRGRRARTTSPSTATAATASRRTCR